MIKNIHKKKKLLAFLIIFISIVWVLQDRPVTEEITYGLSLSEYRSDEMGVYWRDVFDAAVDELGVRHFRLSSHWHYSERERDQYNFESLDYQIQRLEEVGGSAIVTLGRRQPGWPECHEPDWVKNLDTQSTYDEILEHIEFVVQRYKDSPAIKVWQVENEPFLSGFAHDFCGDLDTDFLDKEIELVRELDPKRTVLVTDSGNLGLWWQAYKRGDSFGTSVYRYLWNPKTGPIKSFLPPAWYRTKTSLMEIFWGQKESYLIELSLEPWLLVPTREASIDTQFERMGLDKVEDTINFAERTRYTEQYLWGVEWWYWLREKGESDHWEYIKSVIK